MNDREVKLIVKDTLQEYLEDPQSQWTSKTDRLWIHTDKPLVSATFPRIQIVQRGPAESKIISMGSEFWEWRSIVLDVWFWTKSDFKWKLDDKYLKNEELVNEFQEKIWNAIKPQIKNLHDTYKITGFAHMGMIDPKLDEDTQLYAGATSIRVWYFKK